MKILLVNKYWRPVGGVEEHAFMVKRTLEELGHEVIPFSMVDAQNVPSGYEEYFVSQVEFRGGTIARRLHAVGRAAFGLETVKAIRRLIHDESIDAAHVLHAYHQLGTSFMLELRRLGVPIVLSLHDYKVSCPNYRLFSDASEQVCTRCLDHRTGFLWAPVVTRCWDGSALAGAMLSLEAAVTKAAGTYRRGPGAVVVLNDLQARAVVAAGVPPDRVYRIPHFLEGRFEPIPPSKRRRVLYVGRLVPEKGVSVLISACAEAGLPLMIIGDGRERSTLESRARALGADVTFLGEQPRSVVLQEMAESSVLAVPSLWHEVSPLVILEAIRAGCPVAGSSLGGIPDLLKDGRGTLVPPGDVGQWADALTGLANESEAGDEMVARAREFAAREWTREAWVRRLSDAYVGAGAAPL